MAKKQVKPRAGKASQATDEPGLMLVRLQLPSTLHLEFRVESAKEGRSMAKMARRLVEAWLEERKSAK